MAEMNTKDLTTYLKYAADLESSIFRQEKAIEQAKKSLDSHKMPTRKNVVLPINTAKAFIKPTKPSLTKIQKDYLLASKLLLIIGIIFSIFCVLIHFSSGSVFGSGMPMILCILFIISFWCKLSVKNDMANQQQKYDKAIRDYEEAVKNEEKIYQEKMDAYRKESANATAAYERECAIMQPRFDKAKEVIQQMDPYLLKTKEALQKLYDTDIIFPKYRNMVAMCTMYEYFVTGRCTELTGPNGAYNLYEAELRQNLVINRLDTIITQLESIKENQYILYQEMSTTNRIVSDISSDIKNILSNTKTIAKASNISAHNSQVIAKNTEALKFITLISN